MKTSYPTIYNLLCDGTEVNSAVKDILNDPELFTVEDKESQPYKVALNFCKSSSIIALSPASNNQINRLKRPSK